MLAGLSFIHDEDEQRGFVGFNLMALAVLVAAFAGLAVVLGAVLRPCGCWATAFEFRPLRGVPGSTASGPGPAPA